MRESWLDLVDTILRPARPELARCLREREKHLADRQRLAEERTKRIIACEQRIELARRAVFAADDGVVGAKMTELEHEWRLLSRPDPEAGLMDLWARVAPRGWLDEKRWRHCSAKVDAAVALASDPAGVEAAEAAAAVFGAPVRWAFFERDNAFELVDADIDARVHAAMLGRFPDRPLLARDVAQAARADHAPLKKLWLTGYAIAAIDASGVTLEIPALTR